MLSSDVVDITKVKEKSKEFFDNHTLVFVKRRFNYTDRFTFVNGYILNIDDNGFTMSDIKRPELSVNLLWDEFKDPELFIIQSKISKTSGKGDGATQREGVASHIVEKDGGESDTPTTEN